MGVNKRVGIRLTEEQDKAIKEIANSKGLTKSAYIRMIILSNINKEKKDKEDD